MSKQRLYRGKTKAGEWVYGWYQEKYTVSSRYEKIGPYIEWIKDECAHDVEVIPSTVGQSTGLEYPAGDHKTEAYAGDFFTHLDRNCSEPMEIVWRDGSWWGQDSDYLFRLTQREIERCTLVGNATDNPKLLEEMEK